VVEGRNRERSRGLEKNHKIRNPRKKVLSGRGGVRMVGRALFWGLAEKMNRKGRGVGGTEMKRGIKLQIWA